LIEKIRVTNRSMPESKLRSVDSGNVFGGMGTGRERARRTKVRRVNGSLRRR
jgi:hypothetical protein